MTAIAKFAGLVRAFGAPNAALYVFGRALRTVFPRVNVYRYYIVAQPVAPADLLPARRGKSIEVRELTRGDPAFAALPLDERVLDFRFAQDALCLGAFQDGRPIGCLWLAFGAYEEDEVRCVFGLPAGVAWDFDVYLRPDARLGFGFLRLWDAANAELRGRGVGWSMSRISGFNPGSMASHARLKATRVGSLTALKGPRRQLVLSSCPPRVSFGRHDGELPRFRFQPPEKSAPT